MQNKVIKEAKKLGLSTFQNVNSKWVVKTVIENENIWSLEEQDFGKWLLSINEIPETTLQIETALKILYEKFYDDSFLFSSSPIYPQIIKSLIEDNGRLHTTIR